MKYFVFDLEKHKDEVKKAKQWIKEHGTQFQKPSAPKIPKKGRLNQANVFIAQMIPIDDHRKRTVSSDGAPTDVFKADDETFQ